MSNKTISRAADEAGVGVETIRFYERKGLIDQPLKPHSDYRVYSGEVIERIRFIRQAQELGFSLREIDELLSLRTDPTAECTDVQAQALAKLEEVERKITQLRTIRSALKELIAACPKRGPAADRCTILEALSSQQKGRG